MAKRKAVRKGNRGKRLTPKKDPPPQPNSSEPLDPFEARRKRKVVIEAINANPQIITDDVVDFVVHMISQGRTRSEIRKNLIKRLGPMTGAKCSDLIEMARNRLLQIIGKSRKDIAAESVGFYSMIASDPEVPAADRIKARRAVDEILGIGVKYDEKDQNDLEVTATNLIKALQDMEEMVQDAPEDHLDPPDIDEE